MLNISQIRLLAAALGCLAIAATGISLAQDQQPSATQSDSDQATTQPSQPADQQANQSTTSQTDATAGAGQQQQSNQTAQPASPKAGNSNSQQPSNDSRQSSSDSQRTSTSTQQSADQQGKAQSPNNSSGQDWPAPQRYSSSRQGTSDSRNGQGASLGVSITGDTQGITVMRVYPGTPAQQMGLRPRDRITSVNGQDIGSSDEFITAIRGMNPNEQVEIGVVRDGNETTVRGKLEPFSEARRRAPIASSDDWSPNQFSNDSGQTNSLRRTSYEDRGGRSQSGDVEARLTRVEQQLDQLTRDITEIRNSIRSNPSASPAGSEPGAAGRSSTRGPSAFRPTPGEPPSNNLNSLPPQSR